MQYFMGGWEGEFIYYVIGLRFNDSIRRQYDRHYDGNEHLRHHARHTHTHSHKFVPCWWDDQKSNDDNDNVNRYTILTVLSVIIIIIVHNDSSFVGFCYKQTKNLNNNNNKSIYRIQEFGYHSLIRALRLVPMLFLLFLRILLISHWWLQTNRNIAKHMWAKRDFCISNVNMEWVMGSVRHGLFVDLSLSLSLCVFGLYLFDCLFYDQFMPSNIRRKNVYWCIYSFIWRGNKTKIESAMSEQDRVG